VGISYPPIAPTLSGDTLSINQFLNSPTRVARRLRTLTDQKFIADVLLTGRIQASGGGIAYQQAESIYADRDADIVTAGAEFPRGMAGTGPSQLATPSKYGQDIPITDESIGRQGLDPVNRALLKASNRVVKVVDTLALAAIASAVTQTQAATAVWSGASADPLTDALLAAAQIDDLADGFSADTIVVTATLYARLVGNQKVIAGLARESSSSVTSTGEVQRIAGLVVRQVPAARMPAGVTAMVLDSTQLGALGYEDIPSPEYSGPADGVQSWTRRDPDARDTWLVRVRRAVVPIVQEPSCCVKITGA
jgi:hypothetical protein